MKKKEEDNHNREKIIRKLKENLEGFTVSELSKKLGISRQTVSNCFAFLEGAEKIKTRQTGMAKIYFWIKKGGEKRKIKIYLPFGILVLAFLITFVTATNFVDNGEGYFNNGTYYQTEWNSSGNFVWLTPSNNSGNYTSQIFNATKSSTWNNISWISSAIGELPDNQIVETEFGSGNIDMTGNEFLAHLNNDSAYGENDTYIYDFSGLGNNGTVTGAVPTTSGKFNGAFEFDGVDDTINISTIPALSGVNVTISAWIYYKGGSGTYDPIVTQSDVAWTGYYFYVDPSSSDRLGFWLNGDEAKSLVSVPTNEWHHVVGAHNDTYLMVYMDGVLLNTKALSGSGTAKDAFIGCDNPNIEFFNGTIDEVTIWNKSLSLTEIKNLYKRGATELNLTVRSCDDENCVGESFIDIGDSSPQDLSVSNNQYFQYKFDFTYSPELYNVTIDYTLSDITPPPTPPSGGGGGKTYWKCDVWNEWSECLNNKQTRECEKKVRATYFTQGNLTESRDCSVQYSSEVEKTEEALFDVIVSTLPESKEIFPDTKEVSFQIDLIKFKLPEELTKIKVSYKINKEDEIIHEESEDLEVQKGTSFIKTISLPELSLGTYQINIKIEYGDKIAEGKTSFIVNEKTEEWRLLNSLKTIKGKIYLSASILILVLITGIILFFKFRKINFATKGIARRNFRIKKILKKARKMEKEIKGVRRKKEEAKKANLTANQLSNKNLGISVKIKGLREKLESNEEKIVRLRKRKGLSLKNLFKLRRKRG